MQERERFSSRFGFIIVSIGCAVGLGNLWLMPFRVGNYGGGLYILLFVIFALILAIPGLTAEYAVGRGSGQTIITQHKVLQPKNKKWRMAGYLGMAGNYFLSMFYTTIVGFCLAYLFMAVTGALNGLDAAGSTATFAALTGNPVSTVGWTVAVSLIAFAICFLGLQKGVERIGKIMMMTFFALLIILIIRSVTLPGAGEGLAFMFIPKWTEPVERHGFFTILHAAMGQALFSLSVGMGGMSVFGSYLKKERTLLKEAGTVGFCDILASILCCMMIFPAAFAFGIPVSAGSGLLFIVMPTVLNAMPATYFWAVLLYISFFFLAMSTLFGIYENIIAICMDKFGWSRKKSTRNNVIVILILSLPAALGFNVLNHIRLLDNQTFSGVLTFLVSDNIMPIGALLYILFCSHKWGWGWDNFIAEVNSGDGLKFPRSLRFYFGYVLPIAVTFIYVFGLINRFIL